MAVAQRCGAPAAPPTVKMASGAPGSAAPRVSRGRGSRGDPPPRVRPGRGLAPAPTHDGYTLDTNAFPFFFFNCALGRTRRRPECPPVSLPPSGAGPSPRAHRLMPGCRSAWQPPVERSAPGAQPARGHDCRHGEKRAARHCLPPFLTRLTLAELLYQKGKAALKPGFYRHSSFGCQSYCHIVQIWHFVNSLPPETLIHETEVNRLFLPKANPTLSSTAVSPLTKYLNFTTS